MPRKTIPWRVLVMLGVAGTLAGAAVGSHGLVRSASPGPHLVAPLFRQPLPPAKQQLAEKMLQQLASGHNHPGPRGSRSDLPPGHVLPFTLVAGISAMKQTPLATGQFLGQNFWQNQVAPGIWMLVYAGQQITPTVQGALYVERETVTAAAGVTGITPVGMFGAPTGVDSVRVVGWHGTVLDLETSGGASLTFNIATDRYGAS